VIGAFYSLLVDAVVVTLARMSSKPRIQSPAVARWHTHLHGLATPIREISGLTFLLLTFDLFDNFRNEERKDKQPYGKENLER
jgi:hypothetical protein